MLEQVTSILPFLAVFIPIFFVILIFIFGEKLGIRMGWLAFAASVSTLFIILLMWPGSLEGTIFKTHLMMIVPGIWMFIRADQLGLVLALGAAILWSMSTMHSIGYMKGEHALRRYFSFVVLCLAWTVGVATSGNLFTYLIFYELFSISTYPLIVHEETPEALAAGKKYMIYILVGSSFILFAIIYTYFLAGTLTLSKTGILSLAEHGRVPLLILFWSYMIGFGVKAAIMPLHGWVPDAHPIAPAPFSAILSGVMVAVGTFGIMRVTFNVFGASLVRELGISLPMAYIVAFTIIVSSLLALDQDNLKRRLAYSTIGQMSYIVLGTVLLTTSSVWGAVVHIVNHAFMKGTLFMCAGNIIKQTGKKNISQMRGIGSKLPLTMAAFTVAALGMIGVPPLAGFISKWYLCIGSLDAKEIVFVVVLLLSSLLGAAYFLPIIYTAFFQKPGEETFPERHGGHAEDAANPKEKSTPEAPKVMIIPILVGAAGVIIVGLFAEIRYFPLSVIKIATSYFLK
ncbi:MAG TPA: hypothetical protein ENN38_07465 [Actinobacteria bacterium]|nr:hypothetical protein [Actinomycetota bacterium]